jgi:disulfide bond formation protein DsbB
MAGSPHSIFDHPRLVPAAIVAVSLGALGAALLSQYVGGLQPCVLCIYQRYALVGALAAGLIGIAAGGRPGLRRVAVAAAGLAFLAGAAIAFFHVGVEQLWWRGTAECQGPAFDPNASAADLRQQLLGTPFAACDQIPWSLFGISIAGYNMLTSLVFAAASLFAAARMGKAVKP